MHATTLAVASLLILVTSTQITAAQETPDRRDGVVSYQPMHPLADVAGFVIQRREDLPPHTLLLNAVATPPQFAGGLPPNMPGWPMTFNTSRPMEGAVLVNADADPESEILFSSGKNVHLMNIDGTSLPGWPKLIPTGNHLAGGPAFGDLDGDGEGEVIVAAENWPNGNSGWVYAYHTDGTLVAGFPATSFGDHMRSPTVVDLDGDGAAEIIIGERDWPEGKVYVFSGDGSTLPGWPVDLNHVPAASAGAADLDGDGIKEIVYESYESVYAFHIDGSIVDGFPFTPTTGDVFSYSAPVFADVDGDGLPEIAIGGHNLSDTSSLFILDGEGNLRQGWPKSTTWWIYAPATFVDLDGDGDLEIIVGDQVGSGSPANTLRAWNLNNGPPISGFPIGPIWAVNAQVVVADIDGDTDPELIWDDNTTTGGIGRLLGYHHTGNPIDGWPLVTQGTTFFNTASLGDCDDDGDLELLAMAGTTNPIQTTVYLWDLQAQVNTADIQMPMFQNGPGRHGVPSLSSCPWDLDNNGSVSTGDLLALFSQWGTDGPADFDESGAVGTGDLLILFANWGPCP